MADKSKELVIDKPDFNIGFQMSVIKLMLQNEYFCNGLIKYLGNEIDGKNIRIFDNILLDKIFDMIVKSYNKYKCRPTEVQLRQSFNDYSISEKEDLNDALTNIMEQDLRDSDYYKSVLKAYIIQIKFFKGQAKIKNVWKDNTQEEAIAVMQTIVDDVRKVSFEKDNIVTMKNIDTFMRGSVKNARKIKTGIDPLDKDLSGGMSRQNLIVPVAGSNVGKTLFVVSLGVHALKQGLKVFHISLEGTDEETIFKYLANIAEIDLSKIDDAELLEDGTIVGLTQEEIIRFEAAKEKYESSLRIQNIPGFGATIEQVQAICREVYKEFPFDELIVDYGQLLGTTRKNLEHRLIQGEVYKGLDAISKEMNCVVISPVQANRSSQKEQTNFVKKKDEKSPVLRMTDISESADIYRVAAVIITLNRTDDESAKGLLRVFLDKQRKGAKGIVYGLYTNYAQSNLITGKFYNPNSTVHDVTVLENKSSSPSTIIKPKSISLADIKVPLTKDKQVISVESSSNQKDDVVIGVTGKARFSNKMKDFLDNLADDIIQLKNMFFEIQAKYEDERENEYPDESLIHDYYSQMEKINETIKTKVSEMKENQFVVYERVDLAILDESKKTLADMKKSNADQKQIIEIEAMVKHFEILLGKIKLPTL